MPRRAEIKTGKSEALHVATHAQLVLWYKHSPAKRELTSASNAETLKVHRLTEKGSKALYLKVARCQGARMEPRGRKAVWERPRASYVSFIFQPGLSRLPVRAGLFT